MEPLRGIHHVTAIAADPQQNVNFYSGLLGLRLVKKTVNFDDPGSYHLYYGDRVGSPGSIITFFIWSSAVSGRIGTGEPVAVALSIPEGSLAYWEDRIKNAGLTWSRSQRWNQQVISVADSDGLAVELIESAKAGSDEIQFWADAGIPETYAIRGLHSVTLAHSQLDEAADLFRNGLGFDGASAADGRLRYQVGAGAVDVVRSDSRHGRMGAGTIHHVAFRVADDAAQLVWQQKVMSLGLNVSPVMDRNYFHSIYFREPGGVLFEIATDTPGFAVDEAETELGRSLKLPKWYESLREQLEKRLPQFSLPQQVAQ